MSVIGKNVGSNLYMHFFFLQPLKMNCSQKPNGTGKKMIFVAVDFILEL